MNATHITENPSLSEADPGYLTGVPTLVAQDLAFPVFKYNVGDFNRPISHRKILHEAQSLARRLLGLGPRYQARVALIVDRHLEFVRYFMACRYAGLVPIRLPEAPRSHNSSRDTAQLRHRLVNCKAEIAIASDAQLPLLMKAAAGLNLSFYGGTGAFIHLPEEDILLQATERQPA